MVKESKITECKITDTEADKSIESLGAGKVLKVPDFDVLCKSYLEQNGYAVRSSGMTLSDSAIKILEAVVQYPMRPSTEYIKLAGISPNTLSKTRLFLLEAGYIKEHLVSHNRGRPRHLWEPLEKAIEYFKKSEC